MNKLKEIEIQIKELENQYNTSKNNTNSLKESLDKLRVEQHELQQKQNENLRNKKELGYFSPYIGKYIKLSLGYSFTTDEPLEEGYIYYKLTNAKLELFNSNDKSVYLYMDEMYLFEFDKDGSFNIQIDNKKCRCHFDDIVCGRILFEYPKYMNNHVKKVSCVECDVAEKEIKELLKRCHLGEIK